MRKYIITAICVAVAIVSMGQYTITMTHETACTAIKNQQKTGTCWSFATCSFLESELMRIGKEAMDLSEMYVVRSIYLDKARNYVLRQGKANFSEGSLSHDFIHTVAHHGIVPEAVFSGKDSENDIHDHGEMVAVLKGMLDGLLKRKRLSTDWVKAYHAVLDVYLGTYPEEFAFEGTTYTPRRFARSLGLNPDEYINITSFSHHPFHDQFVLEIPDNFSNALYYNVELDELERIVDDALANGYSVAWDGDVGEKGFSSKHGLAILPSNPAREDLFENPGQEIRVTQQLRQAGFESFATTDDHLMHIVGVGQDQHGEKYYKVKNSWGEVGEYRGFLYMSAPYFRMKTIAITVHRDAVPDDIAGRLFP